MAFDIGVNKVQRMARRASITLSPTFTSPGVIQAKDHRLDCEAYGKQELEPQVQAKRSEY